MTATLVLVHGGTVTSTMWDRVLPHLRTPAVAPDLPGRRYRPADLGAITIADWSQALADEIVERDLHDVVLVGHSSGGYVIPGTAARVPDRLRSLVFISATVPSEGTRVVDHLKPKLAAIATENEAAMRAMAAGRTLGGLRPGEPPIETDLEIVENDGRMGLEAPTPLFEPYTWAGFPRSVPRWFARCTQDVVVTPELVDRMLDNMGGATVVDLDAGHDAAATHPEDLARTLDDLAAR